MHFSLSAWDGRVKIFCQRNAIMSRKANEVRNVIEMEEER